MIFEEITEKKNMITKDNIQKVLLELKFISNHGVYTRHFGSADEGFDLEYNFNVGEFIYPDGVQADRNTTQDEHQNESFVVFVCVAQLFERGYLPQHIKLEEEIMLVQTRDTVIFW